MSNIDNVDYYEQNDIWGNLKNAPDIKEKIKVLFDIIPDDVKTIIDIGCGDGVITNKLADKFDVLGVDRSRTALRHVKTEKLLSSSDRIKLPSNSFDLVFSSELLEHLPESLFSSTIKEFKRLAKKYILLSVPNNESLWVRETKCSKCKTRFHAYYHQRRFSSKFIKKLFPEFKIKESQVIGDKEVEFNKIMILLKFRLGNVWYWDKNLNLICPSCGNKRFCPPTPNLIYQLLEKIDNRIIRKLSRPKSHPFWLVVLLNKR